MNRLQFLKLIPYSFFETMKGIYAPLLEDEVNAMKEAVSSVYYAWYPIGEYEGQHEVDIKYIRQIPIAIYKQGDYVCARKAICPHCHVMLHYIQAENRFLCLYCDRAFTWASEEKTCSMPPLATKKINGEWYVQLERDAYARDGVNGGNRPTP